MSIQEKNVSVVAHWTESSQQSISCVFKVHITVHGRVLMLSPSLSGAALEQQALKQTLSTVSLCFVSRL